MREAQTHNNAGKTIGRAWTLAIGLGLAAVLTACGSDGGTTGPGGGAPTPIGAYNITTVNGKALPVALFDVPAYRYEVTGGSIALTSDGKYTVVTNFRQTIPGDVSLFTDSTFGTWVQSGAQINFKNAQDTTAKDQAMWAGTQLTFSLTADNVTTTYVYTKK